MTALATAGRGRDAPARVWALREAIAHAGEAFAEFRSGTGVGAASAPWDAVVLTCATASQASAAREELERRRALGLFARRCELLALPDPPGRRVGSGGATLLALEALAGHWLRESCSAASMADAASLFTIGATPALTVGPAAAAAVPVVTAPPDAAQAIGSAGRAAAGRIDAVAQVLRGRRVLLIHSGGESQRLPAYAALGKIFAPLPVLLPQGVGAAIFDWLYLLASAVPGATGEVTVLSGDVFPVFDPLQVGPAPFPVHGIALLVPAALGQHFGVYLRAPNGAAQRILQKPSPEALRAAGAVDGNGCIAIDTGMLTIRLPALRQLLAAAGLDASRGTIERTGSALLPAEGGAAPWDLYRDWLSRLGIERAALPPEATDVERSLARATEGLTAGVALPPAGVFVHLGTSREFHDAVVGNSVLRRLFPFALQRDSAVEGGAEVAGAFVGRSLLSRHARLGRGAVVDHCRAAGSLDLGEDAMASGVAVPAGAALRVAPGRLCYQTLLAAPLASPGAAARRVTVVLGLNDNPKLVLGEHQEAASCNGQPLAEWLEIRGLEPADLWPAGTARSLWEAKLFAGDDADPDRSILNWLQQPPAADDVASRATRARWRQARRYALRDLLDEADAAAVARWRGALLGDVAAARVAEDVLAGGDENFAELFSGLSEVQRRQALKQLAPVAEDARRTPSALHRARYWRVLADLAAPGERDTALREAYQDRAAAAVREAVSRAVCHTAGGGLRLRPGRRVRVAAPVRIDFGGGWTDTPPFSLERGGAVCNAAIMLNGELPLYAEVVVTDRPGLALEAHDLAAAAAIATRADAAGYCDPSDPFALHKACLVLLGVLDPVEQAPLARLAAAGAGLCVRTGGRIPRGSGLGTSSIIGAALLRALGEVLGRPPDDAELSRQTLALEQLMTTGGGWQDQMGAITPGLKLISTDPGPQQQARIEQVAPSPAHRQLLDAHLVVAYTGHHRLAKNILRQVVMRYLARDPVALHALYQLRTVAGQLARAAAALDLELFGTLVNQAWLLNKTLDPGTSYPAIERLFSALAPHVFGVKLVGAGGGGFLVAVTRQPRRHELVADLMARDREFAYGYVVSHRIWDGGLRLTEC